MTHDEIIEMAQECNLIGIRPHLDGIYSEALIAFAQLVAAKALAQPEQEPVASIFISGIGEREFDDWGHDLPVGRNLLYTTPPQRTWVGLTNDELTDLFYNTNLGQQSAVAQAIALLKERNT